MKIYVVSHYWDNGLSYEDYQDFETHEYYSTYEKAASVFWDCVTSDYEGKYVLFSVELDTQATEELEVSAWITCHSAWDDMLGAPDPDYDGYDPMKEWEEEHYWNGCPKHPEKNIKTAWEYLHWLDTSPNVTDSLRNELEAETDYLHSKNANYQEWKECEEEIKKRKPDILLDELNSMLVELLK